MGFLDIYDGVPCNMSFLDIYDSFLDIYDESLTYMMGFLEMFHRFP